MPTTGRIVSPVGVLLATLAVGWIGLISADENFRAAPVRLEIRGPSKAECDEIQVYGIVAGSWLPFEKRDDGSRHFDRFLLIGLRVLTSQAIASRIESVGVQFGTRTVHIDGEEFRRLAIRYPALTPGRAPGVDFDIGDFHAPAASAVDRYSGYLNWPGDGVVLRSVLWTRMLPAAALIALGWWFRRRPPRWVQFLAAAGPERSVARWSAWDAVGCAFLLGGLAALEWREPFYFAQDDVFAAEMPWILYGFRAAFTGVWPEYLPGIFLGGAFASVGQGQLLYPPGYLSYAIARWGLGNEFAFADVSAVLHIVAGYAVVRLLGRRIGLSPLPAVLAALSFVFSGSVLIMGRSWGPYIPVVVWLPATIYGLAVLAERPVGRLWAIGMGLAVSLYFQVGFPVNPAFACGFVAVGFAYLAAIGAVPWRRIWAVGGAFAVVAGLCLPMALQQSELMAGVDKPGHSAGGILSLIPGMFVPYPLAGGSHPLLWGTEPPARMTEFGFFGGLFPVLACLEAYALWVVRPRGTEVWASRVWLVLAGVAFLLALGQFGFLWPLGAELPLVGPLFRYPFRCFPALVLFCCLAGAKVLSRLLDGSGNGAHLGVGLVSLALLAWHLVQSTAAFGKYEATPYPEPPSCLDPVRQPGSGRVFSYGPARSPGEPFCAHLPHNLGLLVDLPKFDGYSPMHDNASFARARERLKSDPLAAARAYGLRWFLESGPDVPFAPNMVTYKAAAMEVIRPHLILRGESPAVRVSELPGVDPLGFVAGRPEKALHTQLGSRGVNVDATGVATGETVVANVIFSPKLAAYADGRPLPVVADNWDRATVVLDAPASRLEIRYEPRWGRGLALGAVLVVVGVVVAGWGRGRAEANP